MGPEAKTSGCFLQNCQIFSFFTLGVWIVSFTLDLYLFFLDSTLLTVPGSQESQVR